MHYTFSTIITIIYGEYIITPETYLTRPTFEKQLNNNQDKIVIHLVVSILVN